jgi:hypothetical protein
MSVGNVKILQISNSCPSAKLTFKNRVLNGFALFQLKNKRSLVKLTLHYIPAIV